MSPETPLETPEIDWQAGDAPRSARYGDIYFNPEDGLAESRFVFLDGVGLPERWRERARFTVAELGFGLGLNFLATWAAWRADPAAAPALDYHGVELAPPDAGEIRRAAAPFPEVAPLAERLAGAWPSHATFAAAGPAPIPVALGPEAPRLVIHPGDASRRLAIAPSFQADAWYLDGFAPARNPALWTPEVMAQVFARTAPGGHAATFTAAGAVKRALAAAGFSVSKGPGFGRKRERLLAVAPR